MMQDGLHVGLAAWIGAQRANDDFVTWPSVPFAFEPVDLTIVETMRDLEVAGEFARMVNILPRKGYYAEPFSASVLWELYRQILGSMTFAVRPWTREENDAWNSARALLYDKGPIGQVVTSRAYQMYEEYRMAYGELEASGADAGALAMAAAEWIAKGYKPEIESALTTLNLLARRSSQPEANMQYYALAPTALLSTAAGSYAPTGFSPLSASNTDTWLLAEVSVDDLNLAVGDAGPRTKWDAWRASRSGTIRFRYAALEVQRPWFTPVLFEADDWKIATGSIVSEGNSVDGLVPAYVTTVYLVIIEDVRKPPQPPPRNPPSGGGSGGGSPHYVPIVPSQLKSASIRRVRKPPKPTFPNVGVVPPGQIRARPSVASIKPRVAIRDMLPLRGPAVARVSSTAKIRPSPETEVMRTAVGLRQLGDSRPVRFGHIQQITATAIAKRLALARRLAERNDVPVHESTELSNGTAYVTGFGCASISAAPTPNPDYEWQLK